jgi:hypothetical protein
MDEAPTETRLGKLPPLAVGRAARIVFGLGSLASAAFVPWGEAGGVAGGLVLVFFGLSFLVGGLMANPGCEVTALLNLLLPAEKRLNFPRIVFTPLDRAEHAARAGRRGPGRDC